MIFKESNNICSDNQEAVNLWKSLKKGDIDALGKLYDIYIDELFAYGIKITSEKSLVMDVIHDLFLNLYKSRSKLANVDKVKAYLFKSLKRAIHKKKGPKIIHISDSRFVHNISNRRGFTSSWEEELISLEQTSLLKRKMKAGLKLLTKNQRKGIQLRFIEEKTYEEIAAVMSISISSARTNIYRALKMLRKVV